MVETGIKHTRLLGDINNETLDALKEHILSAESCEIYDYVPYIVELIELTKILIKEKD